jgi:hypothetical protein
MMSSVMQFFNGGIKVRRLLVGINNAMVALSGGGQPGAPEVQGVAGVIVTCAAGANSITLPPWQNGRMAIVVNQGADAAQVFSYESVAPSPYSAVPVIQVGHGAAAAGTTGVSVGSGTSAMFLGGLTSAPEPVWNQCLTSTD